MVPPWNEVRYLKCRRMQDVELVEDERRRAPMERTICEVPYLTHYLGLSDQVHKKSSNRCEQSRNGKAERLKGGICAISRYGIARCMPDCQEGVQAATLPLQG